jgi:hypothetical protein
MRKKIIVEVVRSLPAMRPRPTHTGHALAPLYSPLSIATVSTAMAQLKQAWSQHNHELASALKDAQCAALFSMRAELTRAKQEQAAVIRFEQAMAARAVVETRGEGLRVAQAQVGAGEVRRERQAARQKILEASRAFGAAAAAEGRLVSGQQRLRAAERRAHAAFVAGARRREVAEWDAERAGALQERMHAKKTAAAARLRTEGYTEEVHAAHVAAWQEKQQQAAWVREARLEALARVGPAGGLWGAAVPWEVARQPYPVKHVAASENLVPLVRALKLPFVAVAFWDPDLQALQSSSVQHAYTWQMSDVGWCASQAEAHPMLEVASPCYFNSQEQLMMHAGARKSTRSGA